ncbi:MAG: leucine-rich repeat protein [Bacteroidales bacterium]|nr:leucine-rich repeat protein [Bacteroidales bacterium]
MKSLNHLLWGASLLAILSFGACTHEEPDAESPTDEARFVSEAGISSNDPYFTSSSEGGTIVFKASGGEVVVSVDCGCDWIVDNHGEDVFETDVDLASGTLTVSAGQNTIPEDQTATITLMTATQRLEFATITATQSAYGAPEITAETSEWHAPAVGDLTTEIAVEASADWTAEAADAWLTVEKTEDGVSLTAEENEDATERSTKVTLACADGVKTTYEFINVSQDARANVTLGMQSVPLTGAGDSRTVTVEANFDWDFSYDNSNGWFTVGRDGDSLVFTSTADNTTDENYEGVVLVTAGDGKENVTQVQLKVVEYSPDALVLVYTLSSSRTVRLPLAETVDCTVDWGDGTVETVTSTKPAHTYSSFGEHTVSIIGTVTGLSSYNLDSSQSVPELTAVLQWGKTGLTTMERAFYYCQYLTSLPDDNDGAFADVVKFNYAFSYCSSLLSIPSGLFASATSAQYFEYVFAYCYGLSAIPAGLFSKCSEALSFEYAFRSCSGVLTIGEGLFDGCAKATDFYITFGFMDMLTTIPEGLFKDHTAVENFQGVFKQCPALASLPENLFAGCSGATTFKNAFEYCDLLETIPSSVFTGCSAVTTFEGTFHYCPALTSVPAGLFSDCTKATDFTEVFRGTGLTAVPEGLFDKCTAAATFTDVFADCTALASVPENLFSNCTKATSFSYAFYNCESLTSVPENIFSGCSAVSSFMLAFRGAGLTSIPGGLFSSCTAVTDFQQTFYGCTSLKEIGSGLFANNSAATTFSYTFAYCSALTSIPENLFAGCKAVTGFYGTFGECTALTGESAYDVIEVGGESVKVHLYERANYTSAGYTAPTSYASCYELCIGLDDYYSIPGEWGGGVDKDLSAVLGTYTVTGYAFDEETELPVEKTWTLKMYKSPGEGSDIFIDGLTPAAADYYSDDESEYITAAYVAQGYYSEGKILIPALLTGYADSATDYYIGWCPCTGYDEDEGWYYDEYEVSCTLTYDEDSDTWTSDNGMFLGLFYDYDEGPTPSNMAGFLDIVNPGFVLQRTSTETGVGTSGSARQDWDGLKAHTDGIHAR